LSVWSSSKQHLKVHNFKKKIYFPLKILTLKAQNCEKILHILRCFFKSSGKIFLFNKKQQKNFWSALACLKFIKKYFKVPWCLPKKFIDTPSLTKSFKFIHIFWLLIRSIFGPKYCIFYVVFFSHFLLLKNIRNIFSHFLLLKNIRNIFSHFLVLKKFRNIFSHFSMLKIVENFSVTFYCWKILYSRINFFFFVVKNEKSSHVIMSFGKSNLI